MLTAVILNPMRMFARNLPKETDNENDLGTFYGLHLSRPDNSRQGLEF